MDLQHSIGRTMFMPFPPHMVVADKNNIKKFPKKRPEEEYVENRSEWPEPVDTNPDGPLAQVIELPVDRKNNDQTKKAGEVPDYPGPDEDDFFHRNYDEDDEPDDDDDDRDDERWDDEIDI